MDDPDALRIGLKYLRHWYFAYRNKTVGESGANPHDP
jgi:hypothetical protein